MRALVVMKDGLPEGIVANGGTDLRTAIASLKAMGISHKMAVNTNIPSAAYINGFDMIVIPQITTGWAGSGEWLNDSDITIPFFGLAASGAAGAFGDSSGVTGSRTNIADDFFTVSWSDSEYIALNAGTFALGTGTALMTCAATEPSGTGGGEQANDGNVAMWSNPTAGGSKLYVSCAKSSVHAMLPFLVQAAIDDGEITSVPQKAPMCVDLDHPNHTVTVTDPTILDVIAAYVPAGGVIQAGVTNANAAYFANMGSVLANKLKKYENKPFKYCWHDHALSGIEGGNIGENLTNGYSDDVTKTEQDTRYALDKAVFEGLGVGLTYNEDSFYYNSGTNSWDENSIELFSADVSKASSPANDTTQAGYGAVAFRQIGPTENSRPMEARTSVYANYLHTKRKIRGIQLFPTYDMSLDSAVPFDSIVDWRLNFNWVTNSISMCQTMFMHTADFVAAEQDPGVDQHGYVQMQIIADVGNYLSDVSVPFADITKYIPRINYR